MRPLTVTTATASYPIHFVDNAWPALAKTLKKQFPKSKIGIVTSPTVKKHYLKPLTQALKAVGLAHVVFVIPDGEEFKTLDTVNSLYGQLIEAGMGRGDVLVALGGGVIGDMVGFAAATYLRGIAFVQVPTTLLAQVDSSVGGKTGVDHALGKNLIGAFYQPTFVWIDMATLETLPKRQVRAGLAEVVKYGAIADGKLFNRLLKMSGDPLTLALSREGRGGVSESFAAVIRRSCEIKAEIVGQDEYETTGLRALLNFGHTLGHAIEAASGYDTYLHGEAIAVGMVLAAELSHLLGFCTRKTVETLEHCLKNFGLETRLRRRLRPDTLLAYMERDKKRSGRMIKFVVLHAIGKAALHPISIDELATLLPKLL